MGKEGENKGGVSSSTGFCPQGSLIPPSHRDRAQESVRVRDLKIVHVTSHPPLPTPLKGSEADLLKSLTPRSRLGGGVQKGRKHRTDLERLTTLGEEQRWCEWPPMLDFSELFPQSS